MEISLIEEKLLKAKREEFRDEMIKAMVGVRDVLDKYATKPICGITDEDKRAEARLVLASEIADTFWGKRDGSHPIASFWDYINDNLPPAFFDNMREMAVKEFLEKVESLKEQVAEIEAVLPG